MISDADLYTTYGIKYSDVMKEIGVNKSSIYNWKRKSPKVLEICIEHTKKALGKTKVIEEVPNAQMYKNYMISSSKEKDGYYVIWRNGEMIRKTPKSIDKCKKIVDGIYKRSL